MTDSGPTATEVLKRRKRSAPPPAAAASRSAARSGPSLALPKVVEFWAWVAMLVIQMQPLEVLVSGYDPSFPDTASHASPRGVYLRFLLAVLVGVLLWSRRDRAKAMLRQAVPFCAFVVAAFLVSFVVGSPVLSGRYIVLTFLEVAAVPFAAAALLKPAEFVKAWLYTLSILCALSVFSVFALPKAGVVHASDIYGIGSPGDWRGVFATKNVLGHVSSITLAFALLFGRDMFGSVWIWAGAMATAALCVVFSHSSTAYIISVVVPAFYYSVVLPKGRLRALSIIATSIVAIFLLALHRQVVDFVLALLHKQANLSGRTDIWRSVGEMVPDAGLLGHGIGYSSSPDFTSQLLSRFAVAYTHNEFLDLDINLGLVGMLWFIGMPIYGLVKAWTKRDYSTQRRRARDALTVLFGAWVVSAMTETSSGVLLFFFFVPFFGFLGLVSVPQSEEKVQRVRRTSRQSSVQPGRSTG